MTYAFRLVICRTSQCCSAGAGNPGPGVLQELHVSDLTHLEDQEAITELINYLSWFST